MTYSVILVDDHDLIREGLRRAFERSGEFQVVGEAGTVVQARREAEAARAHVLVTDIRLPDGTGLELAKALREAQPDLGIVVLTMYAGDDMLFSALESGASSFVSKDSPSADVIAAARHAVVSPRSFTARNLAAAVQRRNHAATPALSRREAEILRMLSDGLGVAAIAASLYISQSTAKTHISKIYEKLGAANRAQAIMNGIRAGVLSDGNGLVSKFP